MTPGPLHSLFERLFGSADGASKDRAHARQAADLVAGLKDGDSQELADSPERSTALLAGYLDGGLNEAAQRELHSRLSQSPAAFEEVASADAFMEAVTAARETAPADLVAATLARGRPAAVSTVAPKRFPGIWKWSGAVLVLAAAAIAVLVIVGRQSVPTDTTAPMTAKIAPGRTAAPQGPAVAGKVVAPSRPAMVPAGNEATVPSPRSQKPAMAPEGSDAVPGSARPQQ